MTDQELIPENIKQFLIRYIDSIAQLEMLLLLRGEPDNLWNIETISNRLYISYPGTQMLIDSLRGHGFIAVQNNNYIYRPTSEQIRQIIDELANLYAKYLIPITHIIHSKPTNRIQQFADAFRIRKE